MKTSAKSTKAGTKEISPTTKKTATKKTKDVKPKTLKSAKDAVKNESVHLNDEELPSSALFERLLADKFDDSNEKPAKSKQKKNETTAKPKKVKKSDGGELQTTKKNDKAKPSSTDKATGSDKPSKPSNKSNKSQMNGNKKPAKSKDEKKSSSPSSSSKNSNSSSAKSNKKDKDKDKKLAALLQLQDMRPRGPRLASLNASCKMQLLYESEREKLSEQVENSPAPDTDETDASTEDLEEDPVESVVNNFINSNNNVNNSKPLIVDDLMTEEEDEPAEESDDEPMLPPPPVETQRPNLTPEERNERDLLNESISSVINSINDSIKKEQQQKSSTTKKKKKPNKEDDVSPNDDDETNSELSTSKLTSKPTNSKPPKSKPASKDKKDTKSSKTKDTQSDKPSGKKEGKKEKASKKEPKSESKGESSSSSKSTSKEENSKNIKKAKKKKSLVKENEKKRKLDIDESVELIDTRSTKRLASLNASAIMAASYQDEKPLVPVQAGSKQSTPVPPSPKPNYQEHVEVIHKTTTVMNDGVTETIEKIKKITHVSGKIRDRLLAIEMMENENTDDDLISNNCIIEEPETEDEHEEEPTKSVGKSVLQKKINASNASTKQKTSSEVIEEVNCSEPHTPSKSGGYNSSAYASTSSGNRDGTITSLTKTTKLKINKKKHNEKTTVEKYKYEVHGAYNPMNSNHLSIENIRTPNSDSSPFDKTATDHQTTSTGLNCPPAAAQFIPLQANPYALHSTPGYCIYPNAGAALQLAYQQQLQQAQQQLQQAAQQQAQLAQAYLAQQAQLYQTQPQTAQFSTIQPQATAEQPSPSTANLSSSNNAANSHSSNSTSSSSNFTKKSYKSAFNAVPHNSATSSSTTSSSTSVTTTTSKTSKTTTESSSKVNGVYQLPNVQSMNDNSYLIHKPLAFNGATGSPIFNTTNNVQLTQMDQMKSPTAAASHQINTIIHPAQQASNLLAHSQASSLIPAMQMFPSALTGSPYIFQYPTSHGLAPPQAPDLTGQLSTFHHSQAQLPSSALISPAAQYSSGLHAASAFAPNLNIALIPGLGGQAASTPFLSATQQLAAAQGPMFVNPLSSINNAFSAVPSFSQAVPSSIGVLVAGTAILTDLKDSTEIADNLPATTVKASSSTIKESKSSSKKSKELSGKKADSGLLNAATLTLNHQPLTLNSNTTTTTSTETKSAIIKIRPSQALSSKSSNNHLPATSHNGSKMNTPKTNVKTNSAKTSSMKTDNVKTKDQKANNLKTNSLKTNDQKANSLKTTNHSPSMKSKHVAKKPSEEVRQNGDNSIGKSISYATGIRKERKKKLSIASSELLNNKLNSNLNNNSIKVNNLLVASNGIAQQPTKLNQQVAVKEPKQSSSSTGKPPITNSTHHTNSQRLSNSKHFLPCSAPEPTNRLNLVGLNGAPSTTAANGLNAGDLVMLVSPKTTQPAQQTEAFTIVLNKKDAGTPKPNANAKQPAAKTSLATKSSPTEQPPEQPPVSSKKLKIDLQSSVSTSTPNAAHKSNGGSSIRSSVTITPIALNSSSTSEHSPSLTAVQLDTASMRAKGSGSLKAASTNNMLNNQTGKCLEIHPCNFYSSSSSAVAISSRKLVADSPSTSSPAASNPSPTKANDANLDAASTADHSMKGSAKKAAKSGGQTKQSGEKLGQEQALQMVSHGWKFEGEPTKKMVMISDNNNQIRDTYTRMRHKEGEVINVRDCALLRSGPKDNDRPFVAKISALYEDPTTKAMMMNVLWYYLPEHTDGSVSQSNDWPSEEIFASKHRDVNSVACIDDRCYVLTFNEYCRYKKRQRMLAAGIEESLTDRIVPKPSERYHRQDRLPPADHLNNDNVFCCRKVYDSRNKRILKNPS